MQIPERPENEKQRLESLNSYQILHSLPEKEYDDITAIASEICNTPIALISLIDDQEQWFKSKIGIEVEGTSRDISFCGHAILNPKEFMLVEDARKDIRFNDNPLVLGSPQIVFYGGLPLVSNSGHALGTLCVIDNQPRALSESQLNSLRALARQITQLLELRKSKLELEERNQTLNRFAAVAAHDLKAPLNNITMLTELLLNEHSATLNADGQKILNSILYSSTKLRSLVNGLLDYSKNYSELHQSFTTFQVEELKTVLLNLLNIPEGTVVNMHFALKEIRSHRTLIEQILMNLVSNAIKYNDKPHPIITLNISENNLFYLFDIEDNGPGIPPSVHEKIFEPFVVHANKDRFGEKGHGLGLATVKKVVHALGGTVTLESQLGIGTTFHLSIPKV
jgi:signal transduction histidine kinase